MNLEYKQYIFCVRSIYTQATPCTYINNFHGSTDLNRLPAKRLASKIKQPLGINCAISPTSKVKMTGHAVFSHVPSLINSFSANHNNSRGHLNRYNGSRFKFLMKRDLYKYQHAQFKISGSRRKKGPSRQLPSARGGKLSTPSQNQH